MIPDPPNGSKISVTMDAGNRLTVDAGAERLDLARFAGEIEREWLYRTLARHYSLPSAPDGAAARQA
jgi:hypothetical protein